MAHHPTDLAQQALAAPEPARRLRAIEELRRELGALEVDAVRCAVADGASWAEVGAALGISRQAAHKRFSRRVDSAAPPPLPALSEPRIVVTAGGRRAVRAGRAAARAFGHAHVDTSHLLLGLLADADGPAARALEAIGVGFEAVSEAVATQQPRSVPPTPSPPISGPARRALEQSLREARRLGHQHLGAEHILLGIVRDPDGCAAQVLEALGVSAVDLERCLGKILLEAPFDAG